MRVNRGVVRGVSALLGGVVLLAGMAGCARSNENLVEVFEKDPAVAAVEVVPGSGPEQYEITLEDDVDTDDFSEITKRLNDITSTAADDRWTCAHRGRAPT